ncbi:thr operon leader peptide [Hafnia paralvei]|uniref:thr operon leader peptide n=3 Tax=Hafnia TaxID=568 RepID=A0A4Q9EVA2_9GAMM|nr:thr operon leader peptide [Hafnia paralvei]QQE43463.1 thr operon leader peptide [Hafnia alvei]MBW2959406.1 thr operon leader peptide [Hafnia paralvei]NIH32370.1 thr operon leader peptide [Hafnia paralvei]NUN42479.1 thr operon leader peptide [Hafnia paralvei]
MAFALTNIGQTQEFIGQTEMRISFHNYSLNTTTIITTTDTTCNGAG